jgi:hypothetical protein
MEKKKQKRSATHYYSDEEIKFLKDNVKGVSAKELTDKFNQKFGLDKTLATIYWLKYRCGLLKSDENINKTRKKAFEKYNIRIKPLFSERIKTDGYVYIKVKEPSVWVLKHRYIYEKEYGEIPKGYNVIFADGDKTNFNLDHLIPVKHELNSFMSLKHLYFNNAELTKTGINIAKMLLKLSKIKKV